MTALDTLLGIWATEIERRADLNRAAQPALAEGARMFKDAQSGASVLDHRGRVLPVVRYVDELQANPMIGLLGEASGEIPWIPSHRMTDQGTEAALAPLNLVRDLGDVTCGLLLLAPGGVYPEHSHPPQEIYLPLAGEGRWLYGGHDDYQRLKQDSLVYNHPHDRHGIEAGQEPLLALYVLWPSP